MRLPGFVLWCSLVSCLASRQVPKPCPTCKTDLADCLHHAAVNTEMAELIRRLQEAAQEAHRQAAEEAAEAAEAAGDGAGGSKAAAAAAAAAAAGGDEEDGDINSGAEEEQQEGEDEDGGSGSDGEGELDEAGPSSSKQQPPPKKRQRKDEEQPAAAAAAAAEGAAAAAGASKGADEAPAAAAGTLQQQQQGGVGAGRYASEVAQLSEAFPDFDGDLIAGLLEDQGGDMEEVHAYLKVCVCLLTRDCMWHVHVQGSCGSWQAARACVSVRVLCESVCCSGRHCEEPAVRAKAW